jgi:hypothetical protein
MADQPPHVLSFAVAAGNGEGTTQLDVNGSQTVVDGVTTIAPGAVLLPGGSATMARVSLDGVNFRAAEPATGSAVTSR